MLDFNSRSALSDRINFLIDRQIDATAAEEPQRKYLGASIIGHACERHVQYHLLVAMGKLAAPPLKPSRIKRIFDRGHTYEGKARAWLKAIGFMCGFLAGKGREFSDYNGLFCGHVDDVLTGWKVRDHNAPILLPALWECKCLCNKSWKVMVKDHLKNYQPFFQDDSECYWTQVHLYMHYLGLSRCLFTSVNADTMELHHELIEYDKAEALPFIARAQRVIMSTEFDEMVPRCTADRNFYQCKWCDFAKECWA